MVPTYVQILYCIVGVALWFLTFGPSSYRPSNDIRIVMYKIGEVLKEKFVFLSIQDEGNFRLTLISMEGDADIYVTQHPKVPSYEPERYDLHSASCGEDIIDVPSSLKRPIVLGVYGNSGYEVTKYYLRVDMLPNNNEIENSTNYYQFEDKEVTDQNDHREHTSQNEKILNADKQSAKIKTKVTHFMKNGIFGLLEIIAMVL